MAQYRDKRDFDEELQYLRALEKENALLKIQSSVLGSIILYPELFDLCSEKLTERHFFTYSYSRAFAWFAKMNYEMRKWNTDYVTAQFSNLGIIVSVSDLVMDSDYDMFHQSVDFLVEERDRLDLAMMFGSGSTVLDWLKKDSPGKVKATIVEALDTNTLITGNKTRDAQILEVIQEINKVQLGIQSSWKGFNDSLPGFRGGELGIIAGRPGHGKTRRTLELLLALAQQGEPVLFCSFELTKKRIIQQVLSIMTGISSSRIAGAQAENPISDSEKLEIITAGSKLSELPFFFTDYSDTTTNWPIISNAIRRYSKDKGVKVVGLDYIQLMYSGNPSMDRMYVTRYNEIANSLAVFCKATGMDIVAAAQLKREVDDKPMKRSSSAGDVQHCSAFEQCADWMINLWRPYSAGIMEDANGNPFGKTSTEFIIVKNRPFDIITSFWETNEDYEDQPVSNSGSNSFPSSAPSKSLYSYVDNTYARIEGGRIDDDAEVPF